VNEVNTALPTYSKVFPKTVTSTNAIEWTTMDMDDNGNIFLAGTATTDKTLIPTATDTSTYITAAYMTGASLEYSWAKYYLACNYANCD
jgi:hypothetical protein